MITWTESAKHKLEQHLEQLRAGLLRSGADPVEVSEDIRRHVAQEITARNLRVVTAEDLGPILARFPHEEIPCDSNPASSRMTPPEGKPRSRHVLLFLFGVLLPLITLGIELVTHICAEAFFDPIPDLWHVVLVFSVPVVNALGWRAVREEKREWRPALGIATAFTLGVAGYYTLLFLPLVPMSAIAVIFLGMGLLSLAPLFSFIVAWRLRVLVKNLPGTTTGLPYSWWGFAGAAVAMVLLVLPGPLTRMWSQQAATGTVAERNAAVQRLRLFGHEHTMLGDCYGSFNRSPLGFFMQGTPLNPQAARDVYYRVTGKAFNTVPPPQRAFTSRAWNFLDEWSWDSEQGGAAVGGRLKGLSLAQSRFDGLIDADAAWSYVEWTLEFKNVAQLDREARAQVALPPGAVVSRLTLWVNGEEREAAFAGSAQTRAAYNQVVNVQRRDPVLVTSCGPDRVLVQCFPVPRDGGTIKIRLGITAPLPLENADTALVSWPHFIERNFAMAADLEHSVWIESPQPLQQTGLALTTDATKPGIHALHGKISSTSLGQGPSVLRARRSNAPSSYWTPDPRDNAGAWIRQRLEARTETKPGRVIFVIDGAKDMAKHLSAVAGSLSRLPDGIDAALLVAKDGVEALALPAANGQSIKGTEMAARLRRFSFAGGQDNLPALNRAWDLASEKPGSVVLWIHGPQPLMLDEHEPLKQRLFWRSGEAAPLLMELQTVPGPNRVLEKLGEFARLRSIPRIGTVTEDLQRQFRQWSGEAKAFVPVRERLEDSSVPENERGIKSSKHLARLWAFSEVLKLHAAGKLPDAIKLAATYQLVTPVSGAVVLETKEQFQRAGLEAVDPQSVPSVPEPGVILLLASGLALLFVMHRRKRARAAQP